MPHRKTKTAHRRMSRIFRRDGRVEEHPPDIAYLIWLAVPGTAIRVARDERPVMPWEYGVKVGT